MRRLSAAFIIYMMILALLPAGCGEGTKPETKADAGRKVMLIGLDGATWTVIDPLMRSGRMPNIKKLVEGGSSGVLKSVEPMDSPILWTSIATGKSKEKHGITGFVEKLPGEYETAPVSSLGRKTKALWNILSDRGAKVGVINWWATHPAEKVNGAMVAETMFFNAILSTGRAAGHGKGETYPPDLYSDIIEPGAVSKEFMFDKMREFGIEPMDIMGRSLGEFLGNEDVYKQYILQNQLLADESVLRVGSYVYRKYLPDFMAVYFEGTDVVSHFYWKYMKPDGFDVSRDNIEKYGRVVEDYYAFADNLVGRLMDVAGEDTTVLIVSDHGMTSRPETRRIYDLNFVLGELGYMKFRDGETEWAGTSLFNPSENENWFDTRDIYVNLVGRESKGIVRPGADHKALVAKAAAELGKVVTTDGLKVFDSVEILDPEGNDGREGAPAIRATINTGLPAEGELLINGRTYPINKFLAPRYSSGGHSMNGIIVAYGKDVRKSYKVQDASIMDIAPTVLYLMGAPVARDMDGRVLTDILTEGARKEITYTDSYETGQGPGIVEAPTALTPEQKEKLRSLGYVQ